MATAKRPISLAGVGLTRSPTITASSTHSLSADACLAEVVDHIAKRLVPAFDALSGEERKWTEALAYWYHLNGLFLIEGAHHVLSSLSEDQKTSFRLLREWWISQYQRPETTLAHIHGLVDRGCSLTEGHDEDIEFVRSVESSLSMLRRPHDGDVVPTDDRPTTYNGAMLKLFKLEFFNSRGADGRNQENLRFGNEITKTYRRIAITAAWTQQMAFAAFQQGIRIWFQDQDKALENDDLVHLSSVRVQRATVEKYRVSSMISPTVANCSLLSPRTLRQGPAIKPCPWLTTSKTGLQVDMPYYLWDRKDHNTIRCADLSAFVEYTCISHTWGRYTFPSMEAPEKVPILGVPWKVPRNKKFEVTKLGHQLDRLDHATRYVWIDLFCIPQDGSEIMKSEIARQAQIFQNAAHVVAWFNDVESFDGLQMALSIMANSLLYLPGGCDEMEFAVNLQTEYMNELADKPTGLVLSGENKFDSLQIQSNPWFTSLWTLQELCLRPDMWLCSADFEVLRIVKNDPMPIIGIVAFYDRFKEGLLGNRTKEHEEDRDDYFLKFEHQGPSEPLSENLDGLAFAELNHWINATALDRLLDMSRADILAIGDKRICLSRRAEAIMSCLGTTRWYHDIAREDHEKALVLNKYPVAFVAEVQAADPLVFFGRITKWDHNPYDATGVNLSIALDPANRPEPTKPDDFEHIPSHPKGTMLPFSMHGGVFMAAAPSSVETFDCHNSIKSWVVRPDGRVHIPEACIVASTDESFGQFQHIESWLTTDTTQETRAPTSIDLQKWIQARSFECHALVVATRTLFSKANAIGTAHDGHHVAAIVFNGFILGKFSDQLFVKLSSFLAVVRRKKRRNAVIPPATITDWLVA